MLDDFALFVAIVEQGSLQAAARQLGMPAATLTRRLQRLEATLSCRLLHRSARLMRPTREGWFYYQRCQPLLEALQQELGQVDAELHRAAGEILLLAPGPLADGLLAPVWPAFLAQYPEIKLQIRLNGRREDLLQSGADLALRVGEQPDSGLQQRLLMHAHTVLVASPDYLARKGWPQQPADLADHDLIVAMPHERWLLNQTEAAGSAVFLPQEYPQAIRCNVNEMPLAVKLACAGVGILYCPLTSVKTELDNGELCHPLQGWQGERRAVYAVWPAQKGLPARVRLLLDYLCDFVAS